MAGNVICSKCGQENDADQTFCGSCGAFLEWSGQKVDSPAAAPPATPPLETAATELAGLARARPVEPATGPVEPGVVQPPLVLPVRPGPSPRSVPAGPADAVDSGGVLPAPQRIAPPDPTIACPACGRPNPLERNFCHSCGSLLRPKPPEPAARRRGTAGSGIYRPLSILLLVAIILVASFLLTRLTAHTIGSGAPPNPTPSPSKGSAGEPTTLAEGSIGPLRWSVDG